MRRETDQSSQPRVTGVSQSDSLSVHRSFVLRLYPSTDFDAAEISGRIEHIVSGETREFCSMTELLHAIEQLLRRAER
jgi:hypothetical protein